MAMRRSPTTVAASRRQADVYVVDSERMDPLDWVCEQGVVLQSARGPLPNLAEQIAGEPISGSWWGHSSGHEIFAVLTRLLDSSDVIATRLVNGKITLIHRRLWPAVVRVADRFPAERLAAVDRCTRCRVLTGRSRSPSPSGFRPKTLTPPRCSPSMRRSRCCLRACADGRLARRARRPLHSRLRLPGRAQRLLRDEALPDTVRRSRLCLDAIAKLRRLGASAHCRSSRAMRERSCLSSVPSGPHARRRRRAIARHATDRAAWRFCCSSV
jgi:hypothetical protein